MTSETSRIPEVVLKPGGILFSVCKFCSGGDRPSSVDTVLNMRLLRAILDSDRYVL